MRKKTLVSSHKELEAIRAKLREQISATEKNFVKDHETISRFIGLSGIYKNQKHKETKTDIHSLIVKLISDMFGETKIFGEKHQKLNNLVVPSLTLGLSLLVVNMLKGKQKEG